MLAALHGPGGKVTHVSIRARMLLAGEQAQASLNGRSGVRLCTNPAVSYHAPHGSAQALPPALQRRPAE
jgi:hypothetical protein